MSLTTIKAYLLNGGRYLGLRPSSIADTVDEVVPALSGPGGGMLVEIVNGAVSVATSALQQTLNGYVQPGVWTPALAASAADSGVIALGPTTVRSVMATNAHSAARYLQLYDTLAVPADGVHPRLPAILVPAETTIVVQLGGLACSTGLSWAMSSTQATKTVTSDTAHVCSAELV